MKVFITKYALTDGIREAEAEPTDFERMISERGKWMVSYFHKPDWHTTRQEAIAQAESMRVKKIASLKKQIAKLEAMKFE